ncbi:MAG: hypothetical protein ACRDWH_00965 [Acidimicrobiia bacterium]
MEGEGKGLIGPGQGPSYHQGIDGYASALMSDQRVYVDRVDDVAEVSGQARHDAGRDLSAPPMPDRPNLVNPI